MTTPLTAGLVQANPRTGDAVRPRAYLPQSAGLLEAYARRYASRPEMLRFLQTIAWRVPIPTAVARLREADVVGFSAYVWNSNYSLALAKALKEDRPERLIVFGGPHVPDDSEGWLRAHRFVDIAVHGEGERAFLAILESAGSRNWSGVPSISYLGLEDEYIRAPRAARIQDLDELPSPFLSGTFDSLLRDHRDFHWQAVWETNRGCPFSCTFCDWGSATGSKVFRFGMERIAEEADWIARTRIDHVFLADANFGILPRDVEIAEILAGALERHQSYLSLCIQNTKNATERSYQVHQVLRRSPRIGFEPTVSVPSIDRATLIAVKRDNISLNTFQEIHRRAERDGITTYTDVILGLPGETYDSFTNGVSELIRRGQHNKMAIYNCQVLPNAEMARPDYRRIHGLECVYLPLNPPKPPGKASSFPEEYIETIVATWAMPREAWVRARAFSWMTLFLYMGRILQIPLRALAEDHGLTHRSLIEAFLDADAARYPILARIAGEMVDSARRVQAGEYEFRHREDLLNLWWAPELYPVAWLGVEGLFGDFYAECTRLLGASFPAARSEELLEAVALNEELLIRPTDDIRRWLTFITAAHPKDRLKPMPPQWQGRLAAPLLGQFMERGNNQYA